MSMLSVENVASGIQRPGSAATEWDQTTSLTIDPALEARINQMSPIERGDEVDRDRRACSPTRRDAPHARTHQTTKEDEH
jgi:hypothetical protein